MLDGSPAQEAGLYVDDELVALDGWRVDAAGLLSRTEDKDKPTDARKAAYQAWLGAPERNLASPTTA
ncbi:hypothetical protein BON30_34480 [Cystobacter ferrugineus]|uniref:PDZ domain-containing protein n=1 Tax=Cystobacter ferrugineus TaxID=83449 RepID=A0A1L9B1X9_9BACT|nr:hypothetical protein BON30_34480 [Cystobacter ferrugineus]